MAFGFLNLPKSKWWDALRQVVLKNDFKDIETALLEAHGLIQVPNIAWIDATSVKVPATADCPAAVLMSGFPNILHPGAFVSGGLSDGKYRVNSADATMDFDVAASLWGLEKVSQWYVIFALAADADAVFTIKAMPFMRVCSDDEITKVISLGTLVTPATGRRYGFATDEFIDGMVYVLTGASQGLMRTITANDNATGADGTSGTITYTGTALSLAAGDWFIVLPPVTNFRLIGTIFNNSGGDIEKFRRLGTTVQRLPSATVYCTDGGGGIAEDIRIACPLATSVTADLYGEMGYPSATYSAGSKTGQAGRLGGDATVNLEFCRYYSNAAPIVSSHSYPPGGGY